jgi:FkbM family methyltransferase
LGALSRRLDRPELLAAFYAGARREQHEETAIAAIVASTLRRDACYVDVGTNRGQLLRQALHIAPQGRHLAFEPIPSLAAEIERELPAVECRRLALSAQPGRAQFCHFRDLDGFSGLRRRPEISDSRGRPELIDVQVSTLDAETEGITPSVVKIDVEGAELDVLRGGRSLLARAGPLLIFEHVASAATLYEASSADIWDLLSALDYEIYSVIGEGPFNRADFQASMGVVNWVARPARHTVAAAGAAPQGRGAAHEPGRAERSSAGER